jgi:L-threonylcarbamoyladenylate synthase
MPQILKVNSNIEDVSIQARKILLAGGVIAFPTDTFYGLGVDPFNQKAVDRIYKLKDREKNKPLILLISSKEQLQTLVKNITPTHSLLMQKFWPGPLTLLFEPSPNILKSVLAGSNLIGIRQPGNKITRKLISALGQPITAPSANLSGESPPITAEQVNKSIGKHLDLIIDGGTCQGGEPSTLVNAVENPAKLVREGAILFSKVKMEISESNLSPEVIK